QAGHDALSPYPLVNAALGLLHTFVLTPFYARLSNHFTPHQSLQRASWYLGNAASMMIK
ncbi:hypothetical protein C8F04DRAFT_954157, partial [Mycena alexandri]